MLTIDRDYLLPSGEPDAELLRVLLETHAKQRERFDELHDIYEREHAIKERRRLRGLPNNRLAHDLPGYIVTMAAGYLVGNPVTYTPIEAQQNAFEGIEKAYRAANVESVDAELAVDAAVYGKGVELCYADAQARPRVAQLDARAAFVVYDDTVEHAPLIGVAMRELFNRDLARRGESVTVYTDRETIHYERVGRETPREVGREAHWFGAVPMTEYWNNAREQGDFEPVMSLIDAYDTLQSDRVNDKQQFTDAVFVLKGVGSLGVDDTEEYADGLTDGTLEDDYSWNDELDGGAGVAKALSSTRKSATDPSVRLRQTRTLFLPGDGADAEFVVKPDAESGNEVLRSSLKSDIHKLSMVPDLTDEEFAGNVSGVAMRFKLLGLEQLTKIKERWFREGLRSRLRLFASFLATRGAAIVDADCVQIGFARSLPVNELETAQTMAAYAGLVPRELLLGQVPFVENARMAMEMLEREKMEKRRDEELERRDGEILDAEDDEANGGVMERGF